MLDVIQAADAAILLWIQEFLRLSALDTFFACYTRLGDAGFLWIGTAAIMLAFKKTRKAGFWGLCAMLLGVLCTNVVLKHLVGRARPYLVVEGLRPLLMPDDPFSFPSGHTTAAIAAVCVWWRTLPWRWARVTGVVLAALMGLSRLYVGVHFPTDVLGGVIIGLLCSSAVLFASQKLMARREERLR